MNEDTSTATTTAPTPAQRLAAQAEAARLTQLRDDEPVLDISGKRKALTEKILDQYKVFYAPEPAAPPARPAWQENRAHRLVQREMDGEIQQYPQDSPQARQIIEDKIAEYKQFASTQPAQPKPGAFSAADVRRVTQSAGLDDADHLQFTATADRLGASPVERMQWGFALRDATPEPLLDEDEMHLRVNEWWGETAADELLDYAERGWTSLTAAERRALNSRRGNRQVVERLVELGRRLERR